MLEFIGEALAAEQMLSAIKAVTRSGQGLTPYLGGNALTSEVGDAIVDKLRYLFS